VESVFDFEKGEVWLSGTVAPPFQPADHHVGAMNIHQLHVFSIKIFREKKEGFERRERLEW